MTLLSSHVRRSIVFRQASVVENSYLLIFEDQIGPIPLMFFVAQIKPKHFEREVRRACHLSARIMVAGRAHCECQVLDISTHGAKVIVPSDVPDSNRLFSRAVNIGFAKLVGDAPRGQASGSFFEQGRRLLAVASRVRSPEYPICSSSSFHHLLESSSSIGP